MASAKTEGGAAQEEVTENGVKTQPVDAGKGVQSPASVVQWLGIDPGTKRPLG